MPSRLVKLIRHSQKVTLVCASVAVLLLGTTFFAVRHFSKNTAQKINYSQLYQIGETGTAESLTIDGETLTIRNHDGSLLEATVTSATAQQSIVDLFRKNNAVIEFRPLRPGPLSIAMDWFLPILTLALVGLVGWRLHSSLSGKSEDFLRGDSDHKPNVIFAEARKVSPCVIFIDEIDALGRRRGRSSDSATADQDQTLNQLLIEMDGFDQTTSIVVIASTNRPDILDQALMRPGRFDREIAVNLADVRGREAILRVHARGIQLETGLELGWVARGTPGFSGAELANLLNEAAIAATRDNASAIGRKHIEYARDRILMGAERQGFMMDQEERYATAVHEAGHVAVGLAAEHGDPIHKVSILPRGRALGVTQSLPERDRLMKKREYLEDQIAMLLGGRAAEQVLLSTMTAGASNDIQRAVEIARSMVSEFGMSPLGPIHLGAEGVPHSQSLLDRIEDATNSIINAQLQRACETVRAEHSSIGRLVEKLMEFDTLEAEEILECFDRRDVTQAA